MLASNFAALQKHLRDDNTRIGSLDRLIFLHDEGGGKNSRIIRYQRLGIEGGFGPAKERRLTVGELTNELMAFRLMAN